MSKGPGRIQRAILAEIEANPDGAFLIEELAALVYSGINRVEDKHRVAVARALRTMTLPGTWGLRRLSRLGRALCLYDDCSDIAEIKVAYLVASGHEYRWKYTGERRLQQPRFASFADWQAARPDRVAQARAGAAAARRWRDAPPLEKLDREIARVEQALPWFQLAMRQNGNRDLAEDILRCNERLAAMKAERQRLIEVHSQTV
jgi:hypothetical protein